MNTYQLALKPILVAATCVMLAACADTPSRSTEMDYRSSPAPRMQGANSNNDGSGQRLTIQSGEGEKLNLPWFIRDAQNAINSD